MKKPKIVLKNVKFHQGHEWQGVNADVWIDGVKCIHIRDDGNGGCLNIDILSYGSKDPEKIKSIVNDLNKYVDSLPEKPLEFNGNVAKDKDDNVRMFKTSLEDYINEYLYDYEHQKEQKKQEKLMQSAIVFGVPNGSSYSYIKFKRPLSTIPYTYLQNQLNVIVKKNCIDSVVILNTNLKELGLTI